jgi:hypothetical protein
MAALPFIILGCGYTTRSAISGRFKTIYIAPFVNKIDVVQEADAQSRYKTYRPHLETDVTKAVSNRFLFDGTLKPVSRESADVVLKGEVVEFVRDPLRYDSNDEVQEYRINIKVNVSLWDNRENKLLWEERYFTGDTTYFTAGHTGAKSEDSAVSDALSDLSRRIVERAVEEW